MAMIQPVGGQLILLSSDDSTFYVAPPPPPNFEVYQSSPPTEEPYSPISSPLTTAVSPLTTGTPTPFAPDEPIVTTTTPTQQTQVAQSRPPMKKAVNYTPYFVTAVGVVGIIFAIKMFNK